ncbi:MAG: dihydrolipoamide acetyltransferase family protein [Alphaproteobacteria bacterium]
MPTEVIMPKVDMDMATGQISKWFAAEGDEVVKGSCLFEIETDKAAMEVEAPADGILRDITGDGGQDIPVGQVIGWIFAEGETYVPQATDLAPTQMATAVPAPTPAPRAEQAPAMDSGEVRATPLARRLARNANLDLSAIPGSGPRGRIQKADIERFKETAPTHQPPAVGAPSDERILNLFEPDRYDLVPHDNIRKVIARRLVESKSTVPHFYLLAECQVDRLLSLRREINESLAAARKVSVNDMIVKALAKALIEVPDANVSWTQPRMIKHHHVDVGVAVAIPGGLITPIVRNAEEKSLSAIAAETKDLAVRARDRKLDPSEYRGGTTAISNLGMFGTREFSAIINPPHATILAVGAAGRRPIILDDGETVAAATMMTITLSTDHRAVDGALAAKLLDAVKRHLEDPFLLLI